MEPVTDTYLTRNDDSSSTTPPNESNYCWSIVVAAFNCLAYMPSACSSTFYNYFVDGNKPWKQIKYALNLNALIVAFENKNSSLNALKEKFQSQETSPSQIKALLVIEALLQETIKSDTPRSQYRNFIDTLRDGLLMERGSEHRQFLEKICFYRFTEFHCFNFCQNLISSIIKEGIKEAHLLDPLKLKEELNKELYQIELKDQFSYITKAPQQEKAPITHLHVDLIRGGCNIGFDAQRRGNIPFALFDFSFNSKTVRLLRTGSPTIQRNDYSSFSFEGEASITPEFCGLIEELSRTDKKLLHISCQDNQSRYFGSEKARNNAFIKLSKDFEGIYHLAILAHDTPFFYQSNDFENLNDAKAFKNEFIKQIESPDFGFFFSKNLKDIVEFTHILNELHADLYLSKEELTKEERCNFIEIFYTRLTFCLLKKSNADYFMNVCKDTIDRAAIRNALFHYLLLIFYKKENSGNHLNQLYTYLHAGAFIVKKRALNSRKERLLSAFELLKSSEIKERLLSKKESIGVEGSDLFIKQMYAEDSSVTNAMRVTDQIDL